MLYAKKDIFDINMLHLKLINYNSTFLEIINDTNIKIKVFFYQYFVNAAL